VAGVNTETRLRRALWELAEASENIRALEANLDSGEEMGEESVAAEMALERYLSALQSARKLGRSE
jgi:hypothetical protein